MATLRKTHGFTLLEMLVAMTVAAILVGVSLNVYGMFHRGVVETSLRYGTFASEQVKDLRCRTRFIRGFPSCDSTQSDERHMKIRLRF